MNSFTWCLNANKKGCMFSTNNGRDHFDEIRIVQHISNTMLLVQ